MAALFLPTAVYVLQIVNYFVMPDELGYVRQAVAIGHQVRPLLPGDAVFGSYSQVGPILMAPFYALASTTTAFDLVHLFYAALIVSTAIPVYLLGRRLLRPGLAVAAALASVATPWLALSASVLTENVAYPGFAWALLAMHRAVTRPGVRADAIALVAMGVAFLCRAQFIVLPVAMLVAVVLVELRDGPARIAVPRALRAHLLLLAAALLGVVVLFAVSTHALIGDYQGATQGALLPPGTFAQGREIFAYVIVGVGVVPLALAGAWVLGTLCRPRDRAEHAFAALSIAIVPLLLVLVGSFSVRFTGGVNDRYLFFLVPLLMIGTALFLADRRPGLLTLAMSTAGTVALVIASDLAIDVPTLTAPSAGFHRVLHGRIGQLGAHVGLGGVRWQTVVAVAAAIVVAAVAVARRTNRGRAASVLTLVAVAAFGLAEAGHTMVKIARGQAGASEAFIANRDWIDESLPAGARSGLILGLAGDPQTSMALWWDFGFWSKRTDNAYIVDGGAWYAYGYYVPTTIDPRTGAMPALAKDRYLVQLDVDERFRLRDTRTVRRYAGATLFERRGRPQADWWLRASDDDGRILPGSIATLRLYARPGGRDRTIVLRLTADPYAVGRVPARVTGGGRVVSARLIGGHTIVVRRRVGTDGGFGDVQVAVGRMAKGSPGLQITQIRDTGGGPSIPAAG